MMLPFPEPEEMSVSVLKREVASLWYPIASIMLLTTPRDEDVFVDPPSQFQ